MLVIFPMPIGIHLHRNAIQELRGLVAFGLMLAVATPLFFVVLCPERCNSLELALPVK